VFDWIAPLSVVRRSGGLIEACLDFLQTSGAMTLPDGGGTLIGVRKV